MTSEADGAVPAGRGRRVLGLRVAGIVVATVALVLLGRVLAESWGTVRAVLSGARPGWLLAAALAAAASMAGLALLWWCCLRIAGSHVGASTATSWYFAGELGKYLPGSVWTVVGRGELARRRGGLSRGAAYGSVLTGYAVMCLTAAGFCGAVGPAAAWFGGAPTWWWWLLPLLPAAALFLDPRAWRPVLRAVGSASRGRWAPEAGVGLGATGGTARLLPRLLPAGLPVWVLLGAAAVAVSESLGYGEHPLRVAVAAVAAWLIGFLAVPVPAGAGVREAVFAVLCGLPGAPAVTVALVLRLLLVAVDGIGGAMALAGVARSRDRGGRDVPAVPLRRP